MLCHNRQRDCELCFPRVQHTVCSCANKIDGGQRKHVLFLFTFVHFAKTQEREPLTSLQRGSVSGPLTEAFQLLRCVATLLTLHKWRPITVDQFGSSNISGPK